ncbi:hypothetical protein SLEP1_g43148 [Rubroshorea leprosula]|uniref:Uncharacterized protein n=1 Tax=Rubroshorea leprosula TaxID=152421 RepID=A0AAV5LCT8_9ROSI|nr:hypothetical protein SLEP1_g43148 [Rubroshorea leprosula]
MERFIYLFVRRRESYIYMSWCEILMGRISLSMKT